MEKPIELDMDSWNCCRTCLGAANPLYDIFNLPTEHEKYSAILVQVTGLKITLNDSLPQKMCKDCIQHVNNCVEFKCKSQEAYKTLIKMLREKYRKEIENSNIEYKINDYDEFLQKNKTAKSVQSNFDSNEGSSKETFESQHKSKEIFEMDIENFIKEPIEVVFESKKLTKDDNYNEPEYDSYILSETKSAEDKVPEDPENITCKYCSKTFKTKAKLFSHYSVHRKRIVCEHCGRRFAAKRKYLIHCRARHGYEKVDKCSYCDYRASNSGLVKEHELSHTGQRPHVCPACGATFMRRACYLQHLPLHLPTATVPCDECPAMLKSVTLMKIHKQSHKRRNKRKLNNIKPHY